MKKTFLRIGCLLFAIVMMLSAFAGCKGKGKTEDTQPVQDQTTTAAEEKPPVPDMDWDGRETRENVFSSVKRL